MFCKNRTIPQPLPDKFTEELEMVAPQGILEPVQSSGGMKPSAVALQRTKNEARGPKSSH